MSKKPGRGRKIQVRLPEKEVARLDRESRTSGKGRSEIVREALAARTASARHGHDALVAEAARLRAEAERHEEAGRRGAAASKFLLAAAREIEAASLLSPDSFREDEPKLRSSMLLAIQMIKKGTGYRQLPEVPTPFRSASVQ